VSTEELAEVESHPAAFVEEHQLDDNLLIEKTHARLLDGRIALITGGAGTIASATARLFAEHGADVAIADLDASRTEAVVASIRDRGRQGLGIVTDLIADGAVEAAVNQTAETFGRVDILVNALGHAKNNIGPSEESDPADWGPFEESDSADWEWLYRMNLRHVFAASHRVVTAMKEGGWGRIINFSSVEGQRAMPYAAAYTAFKGGIESFTKSLGVEVARYGIRVNAIAVDKTSTNENGFYAMPAEYEKHVPVWVPAGRFGRGEDIANIALFLASDMADWVVGHTIVADGGTLPAGGWFRTPERWTNSPLLVQYFEDAEANSARPWNLR
jgi:2-hydroxycyclohexanecarboxyl-CoA dehydrogenase